MAKAKTESVKEVVEAAMPEVDMATPNAEAVIPEAEISQDDAIEASTEEKTPEATATAKATIEEAKPAEETAVETVTTDVESPEEASAEAPEIQEALYSLDELAMQYRVPTWKQAALTRAQGWEQGKYVSPADYEAALAALGDRGMGGGRHARVRMGR